MAICGDQNLCYRQPVIESGVLLPPGKAHIPLTGTERYMGHPTGYSASLKGPCRAAATPQALRETPCFPSLGP